MILGMPLGPLGLAAGMDIEIFGLASTSKFDMSAPAEASFQIWVCHVTMLPKKDQFLDRDAPLPLAGGLHDRIEPEGRHGDVADCSNNFCLHVRDPHYNCGRLWHGLLHGHDL